MLDRACKLLRKSPWVLLTTVGVVFAWAQDASFRFNPAPDRPTVSVRYFGGPVKSLELLLNGRTVGLRSLPVPTSEGEITFSLPTAHVSEGLNDVEARLYSSDGRLLRSRKAGFNYASGKPKIVEVTAPQPGATVQGMVELKAKLNRDLGAAYVCFYVDGQFAAMKNFPPYEYKWDTSKAVNGWHEIEAWVVDEKNETYKTGRVRVLVANQGSEGVATGLQPVLPEAPPIVVQPTPATPVVVPPATSPALRPSLLLEIATNAVRPVAPKPGGMKLVAVDRSIPTGQRLITPPIPLALTIAPSAVRPAAPAASALRSPSAEPGKPVLGPVAPTTPGVPAGATTTPAAPAPPKSAEVPKAPIAPPTATVGTAATALTAKSTTPAGQKRVVPGPAPAVGAAKAVATATSPVLVTRGTRVAPKSVSGVSVDGRAVAFDVEPEVENGIPVAPIRHILEQAGWSVFWQGDAKQVRATEGATELLVRIGDRTAKLNGRELSMELAAYVRSGRAMVPISFVQEALNATVAYDPATGHISITAKTR